jgi:NAD(P)-dependent dehydrogenase (short-subunit alcohol dehydrogenase family)
MLSYQHDFQLAEVLLMNVLITGANRGIGLALVREYINRGAQVFTACRSPEQASELKKLQTEQGDHLLLLALDVTDESQIAQARELVGQRTTHLDRLINNAGILRPVESFREITESALMDSFAVNALAPLRMIQHFEDLLAAGSSPRIVNITGPTPPITRLPRRNNQVYMASRYAHNALTKMVALELIEKGIITVALWPGYIRTDMNGMAADATPPQDGIPRAVDVIENLTTEHNGCCLLPDGKLYDW